MKSCCVPLCENDTYNRPDLKYFPLPKKEYIREEWLEVLGIKGEYRNQQISVCQIHFRDEDFRAGRKELKVIAVPRLCLQKIDQFAGDEENVEDEIDCKPDKEEVIVKVEPDKATPSSPKKRRPADDIIIKQEQEPVEISEPGRRPSRRAAVLAARKISSTARQCGVKDDDPADPTLVPTASAPRAPAASRKRKVDQTKKEKVNLDLEMTCEDEDLSPTQCMFLKLAQDEYNGTIKKLRELAASNVKITQEGDKSQHVDLYKPINLFAQNGSVLKTPSKVKPSPRGSSKAIPIFAKNAPTPSRVPVIYL